MSAGRLRYTAEIDGLRAIAVSLVVLFHAGLWGVQGGFVGVDVFYVISGYLITSLLVRELDERGTIRLLDFWARRMRRILPAAVLVLLASLIAAALFLPPLAASEAAGDLPSAALYFINWRLADTAVDYFAVETGPNIFLQYWSLAIEEQFYAGWPLILLLVAVAVRRMQRFEAALRAFILWTAIVIAVLSFCAGLYQTNVNPAYAFFGTGSRAWQLAVGGIIALAPFPKFDALARRLSALAGLAFIFTAGILLSGETPYPGFAALLPTAGSAAVIIACRNEDIGGIVGRCLRFPVFVRLGKWSYSWYLWHWPVLVIGHAHFGEAPLALVLLVLLSLVLAAVTYKFVEQPARFSPCLVRSPRLSVFAGLGLSLGAALFGLLAQGTFAKPVITLSSGVRVDAHAVRQDKTEECLLSHRETELGPCTFGGGPKRVVLLGDSHATAWLPALKQAALDNGWTLLVRTKASCLSVSTSLWSAKLQRRYTECEKWRNNVLAELEQFSPDLVIVANASTSGIVWADGRRPKGKKAEAALRRGEEAVVDQLLRNTNAWIVLIQDVPRLPEDPVSCLVENGPNESACSWPAKRTAYPRSDYENNPRVTKVDLNGYICPSGICRAVLGGLFVMRDQHHLTASFATTLSSHFDKLLKAR